MLRGGVWVDDKDCTLTGVMCKLFSCFGNKFSVWFSDFEVVPKILGMLNFCFALFASNMLGTWKPGLLFCTLPLKILGITKLILFDLFGESFVAVLLKNIVSSYLPGQPIETQTWNRKNIKISNHPTAKILTFVPQQPTRFLKLGILQYGINNSFNIILVL